MQNTQQSSNENKTNNHKNTNLLQNQSPTKNQTQISNKTTKPINPTTKPISNKVNLNLQTHKSSWEINTKKIGLDTHKKNKPKPPKLSGKLTKLLAK